MDIMVQVSAVKAAIAKTGVLIFEMHMRNCMSELWKQGKCDQDKMVSDLTEVMCKFIK